MAVAMKLGYRRLARLAYPLLRPHASCCSSLVLVPGVGTVVGGARRWIRLPGSRLQPAEIAKFAWVVYLAYSLAKKREKVASASPSASCRTCCSPALLVLLCMAEPDFGSSVALLFLIFVLLFAAGTKLSTWSARCCSRCPLAYAAIAQLAVPHEAHPRVPGSRGRTGTTSATRSPSR